MSSRIRVLIIDESVLCRDAMTRALAEASDVEVLAAAPNARTGLARAGQLQPDLLLVGAPLGDITPEELVRQAVAGTPGVGLLLVASSAASGEQVDLVVRTLEAGAFDCVLRPACGADAAAAELQEALGRRLLPKIRAFSAARYSRLARGLSEGRASHLAGPAGPGSHVAASERSAVEVASGRLQRHLRPGRWELLAVAVSTGGPEALRELLPGLAAFPLPIAIVIHLPSPFTASLARTLERHALLRVAEAVDGAPLRPGVVQLSTGGRHLVIDRDVGGQLIVRNSDAPAENGCRPSADVLFRSASSVCGAGVLGLIMTGMGNDGMRGLQDLRAGCSCHVIAQDEESSVVWGMPGAVVRAGLADEVLPLSAIATRLRQLVSS